MCVRKASPAEPLLQWTYLFFIRTIIRGEGVSVKGVFENGLLKKLHNWLLHIKQRCDYAQRKTTIPRLSTRITLKLLPLPWIPCCTLTVLIQLCEKCLAGGHHNSSGGWQRATIITFHQPHFHCQSRNPNRPFQSKDHQSDFTWKKVILLQAFMQENYSHANHSYQSVSHLYHD